MPTTITGQNGAQIKQNTKIPVTGCAKVKKKPQGQEAQEGKEVSGQVSSTAVMSGTRRKPLAPLPSSRPRAGSRRYSASG